MRSGGDRPRSWEDLQRAVLEDDYLSLDEMRRRQRYARYLKAVVWLIPLVVLVCGLEAAQGGISALVLVGALLVVVGAVMAYRLGAQWETRWGVLIG